MQRTPSWPKRALWFAAQNQFVAARRTVGLKWSTMEHPPSFQLHIPNVVSHPHPRHLSFSGSRPHTDLDSSLVGNKLKLRKTKTPSNSPPVVDDYVRLPHLFVIANKPEIDKDLSRAEQIQKFKLTRDQQIKEVARQFVEEWAGVSDDDFKVKVFGGGLSNKLYGVGKKTEGIKVNVRVYGGAGHGEINEDQIHLADRDGEIAIFQYLYKNGLGPKFYGTFKNGCVYGFVPGEQLVVDNVFNPKYAQLIAQRLAQWHSQQNFNDLPKESMYFALARNWLQLIPPDLDHIDTLSEVKEYTELELDVSKEMDELEEIIQNELKSPIVFAHNDVQPMNIIYDRNANVVNFIDFEYACYNYRGWDIGNHFCEHTGFDLDWTKFPKPDTQRFFLQCYLRQLQGREPSEREVEDLYVEANVFTLASHLLWGIWGLAQAKVSDIDYNFFAYSLRRLKMYKKTKHEMLQLRTQLNT